MHGKHWMETQVRDDTLGVSIHMLWIFCFLSQDCIIYNRMDVVSGSNIGHNHTMTQAWNLLFSLGT